MSSHIRKIYDTFFRDSMNRKDLVQDLLTNYLPAHVVKHLDLNTLAITKDTFVGKDLAEYYSDLLYQVRTAIGLGFVYLLFEHKSTPYHMTTLQVLRYMVECWDLHCKQHQNCKTLPMIIPIVIYHGKSKHKVKSMRDLVDIPAPELSAYVPDFALEFLDFSPTADHETKGQIITQLFILCLRAKNQPKVVKHFRKLFVLLNQLDDSVTSIEWMRIIITYMNQIMDVDKSIVIELSKQYLSGNKEETIMTLAEQWKMEGRMEGEADGIMKGRMEGQATLLRRLITKRFGSLTTDNIIMERLQKATPEQLDIWTDRILEAKTVEELFSSN